MGSLMTDTLATIRAQLAVSDQDTVALPLDQWAEVMAALEAIPVIRALQIDLLNRAEWSPSAGKVVCAGNSAWFNFCEALDKLPQPPEPQS